MKIMGIHHDLLSLQGPTRLFLMMMDLFKDLGHDVWIVGRTKRATKWKTKKGIITEKLASQHYTLKHVRRYHPLKHLSWKRDFTLAELPLMYPYNYMPKGVEKAIPEMDLVFSDSEIYLPMEKYIPGNYLFYIHWPPKPFREHKPLMPAAPAPVWCNSAYTATEIKSLWGEEWSPQVVYPPMWTDLYDGRPGFESRPFDIVMFSRLYEDKFLVLPELKGYKTAIIGSDFGLKNIPSWVKVWKGVPWRTVVQVLSHAKIYIHSKGWGKLSTGAPSSPEHFGITIAEAMACGCVPIVPNVGGPLEIVGPSEEWGFTFKDVDELRVKIELLLSNPSEWTYWHERALQRVQDFDVKNVEKKVERLLGSSNSLLDPL